MTVVWLADLMGCPWADTWECNWAERLVDSKDHCLVDRWVLSGAEMRAADLGQRLAAATDVHLVDSLGGHVALNLAASRAVLLEYWMELRLVVCWVVRTVCLAGCDLAKHSAEDLVDKTAQWKAGLKASHWADYLAARLVVMKVVLMVDNLEILVVAEMAGLTVVRMVVLLAGDLVAGWAGQTAC